MNNRFDDARNLWDAYREGQNTRVPVFMACDEQIWLRAAGRKFREFYLDPRVHFDVQLKGRRWFLENVVSDTPPSLTETWDVSVQLWMMENEFFGCSVVYQENDYAWAQPLDLEAADLLEHIRDIDPVETVRRSRAFRMYEELSELAEGMVINDKPVRVLKPGGSTQGLFTKALEIRGIEKLCVDLYDDPDFTRTFLDLITEKTIQRIKAWNSLTDREASDPARSASYHFCDDSIELLSPSNFERYVLPCHERLYSAMTAGKRNMHLCGHASQHYEALYHKLGIRSVDGPGPFVNHGEFLEKLGPDFAFGAQTNHTILGQGTPEQIEAMMQALLNPRTKIPGRFHLKGYVNLGTRLENVRLCYDLGKRLGTIEC